MRRHDDEDDLSNARVSGFRIGFQHGRGHEQLERERNAQLMNYRPAPTPPELIAPTKCKVLRAFCIGGKRADLGETVTLPASDADSLAAIGKVAIL